MWSLWPYAKKVHIPTGFFLEPLPESERPEAANDPIF